jgi:hypothetical protein
MHTSNTFRFIVLLLGLGFLMAYSFTSQANLPVDRLINSVARGYGFSYATYPGVTLTEGETREFAVPINTGRSVVFFATTSVDSADSPPFEQMLIRPDDLLLNSDTISGTNISLATDTLSPFLGTPLYRSVFHMRDPMPGIWRVRIHAYRNVTMYAWASLDSDITLRSTFDERHYELGQPITLTASLVNAAISPTIALTQSIITATTTVDGKEQVLTFLDSGELGDRRAGDGIYAAVFTLPNRLFEEVTHHQYVTFRVHAQNYSQSVLRETQIEVPIDSMLGTFTSGIREQTMDEDGDGRLDALVVSATVNLKYEGVVATWGRLISTKVPTVTIASNFVSVPGFVGRQEITFTFQGSDIRKANLDGPYQFVVESKLIRSSDLPTQVTRIYNAQQFDLVTNRLEYDVAEGEDFGVDLDGDGRYDELHVKLKLKNIEASEAWADVYLRDAATHYVSHYLLPPGIISSERTLEFIFQGVDIHENQVNGPYSIDLMWFEPITQSNLIHANLYRPVSNERYGGVRQAWAYIPYTTQRYSYTQFNQPVIQTIKLGEPTPIQFMSPYQIRKFSVTPNGDGMLYVESPNTENLEFWVRQQKGYTLDEKLICKSYNGDVPQRCWFAGLDVQKPYFLYFRSTPRLPFSDSSNSFNSTNPFTVTLGTGTPPN